MWPIIYITKLSLQISYSFYHLIYWIQTLCELIFKVNRTFYKQDAPKIFYKLYNLFDILNKFSQIKYPSHTKNLDYL